MNDQQHPQEPPNPYLATPSGGEALLEARIFDDGPRAKPRVWTVFVTIAVAMVMVIAASIAGAVLVVGAFILNGGTPRELQAEAQSWAADPVVFMILGGCGQMALVGTALVAGWLSPQPLRQRLGFAQPRWRTGMTALTIVGSVVPFAIGMALAHSILPWLPADPSIAQLYENMTPALAIPWVDAHFLRGHDAVGKLADSR